MEIRSIIKIWFLTTIVITNFYKLSLCSWAKFRCSKRISESLETSQFRNIKAALKFEIPTAWGSKFTQKLENFDPSPEKPAQAYITRKQHTQGTRRQFFRCRAFRCKFLDSNTSEFQLWYLHILKNPGPLRYQNHQVLSKLN